MKISLTKSNVMKILCERFEVEFVETEKGEVTPLGDELYWEGNEERENNR